MRKGISKFIPATALVALALAGCGGSGTSTNGGTGGTVYPLTTAEHFFSTSAGSRDTYTYNLTGTVTPSGGSQITVAGIRSEGVSVATFNGAAVHRETVLDALQPVGGVNPKSYTDDFFFAQDGSSNITFVGDDLGAGGVNRTASTPITIAPGTWSAASSLSGNSPLTPSGSVFYTQTIPTQDTITIAGLGQFTCWKSTVTYTKDGTTRSGTYWFYPKLGSYVQANEQITYSDGTTSTLTATLSASTVPFG